MLSSVCQMLINLYLCQLRSLNQFKMWCRVFCDHTLIHHFHDLTDIVVLVWLISCVSPTNRANSVVQFQQCTSVLGVSHLQWIWMCPLYFDTFSHQLYYHFFEETVDVTYGTLVEFASSMPFSLRNFMIIFGFWEVSLFSCQLRDLYSNMLEAVRWFTSIFPVENINCLIL